MCGSRPMKSGLVSRRSGCTRTDTTKTIRMRMKAERVRVEGKGKKGRRAGRRGFLFGGRFHSIGLPYTRTGLVEHSLAGESR